MPSNKVKRSEGFRNVSPVAAYFSKVPHNLSESTEKYEGWNFNSGNYLFTTDTK